MSLAERDREAICGNEEMTVVCFLQCEKVNSERSVRASNPVIHNFGFVMLIREEEIWDNNVPEDATLLAC